MSHFVGRVALWLLGTLWRVVVVSAAITALQLLVERQRRARYIS